MGGFGGLGSRIRGGKEGIAARGSGFGVRGSGFGSGGEGIAARGSRPGVSEGQKRVALRVVTFLFDIGTKKLVL